MKPPTYTVPMDRRTFLVASTIGFAGLRFGPGSLPGASSLTPLPRRKKAKSTILFFLCGGASHIDTWDMKPEAPIEYRGPFKPVATSAPEIQLCEHLPLLARQAHHLAIVRTVTDFGRGTGDHHAGYYYNLTGHAPDATFSQQGNDRRPYPEDWPFMGSVIGSRLPLHANLPQVITLPHKPSKLPYIRPGQFAGLLGMHQDPFYLLGDERQPLRFSAPSLTLQAGTNPERMIARRDLLRGLNDARRQLDHDAGVSSYLRHQERAFGLLSSAEATKAFDIASEPEAVRRRYGETLNAMSLLMARRLVEAGVPFITVFWKEDEKIAAKCASEGAWDTHGNNFACLKENLLPEFDRGFSALLEDLSGRGLLDETLVLVTSEMGRKPKIGDPRSNGSIGAGRDHWTACMSVLLAGGGVRGGQTFGRTDVHAEYPAERPVGAEDITQTVYHAMGIDNLEATDLNSRPINLLADGRVLTELF